MVIPELNLRHLRLMLTVAQTGSITTAASRCNISQPAATHALKKLEAGFGQPLFDRTTKGIFPTPSGAILTARIERALGLLDAAAIPLGARLHLTASTARLKALIELTHSQNFSLAARNLGITQPTVHRAITQFEQELGRPLFRRTQFGVVPTRVGHQLAQAAQLAFAELAQAQMELEEAGGNARLTITIGGMPLSRAFLLPKAMAQFQRRYPQVNFRIVEGPYETLLGGLLRAEIDLLLGALRTPPPVTDIVQEHLFEDEVVVVSGPGHPLAGEVAPDLRQALDFPWVIPFSGTPARRHFDAQIERAGLPPPFTMVETSSMILMRELLHQGPYLGVVSRLQAIGEIENGLMTALPIAIEDSRRAIGLTMRSNWRPTPMQRQFLDSVRGQFGHRTPTG
ncbi:LysR family transcriptional regulator [Pelagibacterium sp. H642]|uniref:LysR family transcriptional regulator n=1 Tax=Pelagibacterium sp. H642 TaxID=1881069 RepID=UPI0028156ECE|nr:LysR family transcriptional regulator [Pelagibacterium sp. H642]WMT91296.1 LysR family transcriptional regulator [Pelagibacterium sp. H642]